MIFDFNKKANLDSKKLMIKNRVKYIQFYNSFYFFFKL